MFAKDPTRLTDAEIAHCLDDHPTYEANALLHAGKPLRANEVIYLCAIAKFAHRLPIDHVLFRHTVDSIMRRWRALEAGRGVSGQKVRSLGGSGGFAPGRPPGPHAPGEPPSPGARGVSSFPPRGEIIVAVKPLRIVEAGDELP